VIGALVDRFAAPRVAGGVALVSAAAFAGLLAPDPGFAAMMLLVFLAGLMNGAEHDLLPFLTARLFGLRAYGEVYGSLLPISLAGTALGIVVFGRIHDAYGHYDPALGVAVAALVGAALAFMTLTDRPLPEARAAAAAA
jgi:predicted MFS family arabinose efflux permease